MSDGPWQGAQPLSAEEARLLPYLEGHERLLWAWDQHARGRVLPTVGRSRMTWPQLLLFCGSISVLNMTIDRIYAEQPLLVRMAITLGIVFGILGLIDLLRRIPALRNRARWSRRKFQDAARSVEGMGRHGDRGLHGPTEHRALTIFRDGSLVQTALADGEPVIQYGTLRVDRTNHRGRPIIRCIPQHEQLRLFAALKQARAIREGRVT